MQRRELLGGASAAALAFVFTKPVFAQSPISNDPLPPSLPVPASGPPLPDLNVVESSGDGITTDLNMAQKQVKVGDRTLTMAAYNDQFPGTLYKLNPGDTLKWTLKNNMEPAGLPPGAPEPDQCMLDKITTTNVHTHGLQVNPGQGGDDVYTPVRYKEEHEYTYKIPGTDTGRPQPAGLHWYHPHKHGSTSHQGWQGLAGPFVISGPIDEVPEVKAAKRDRVLVLNELLINQDLATPSATMLPTVGFSPFTSDPSMPIDIVFTVNGQETPDIDIQPGETQRWRVLAAGPHRFFYLQIDGHEMWQIGQDGIPFERARRRDHIILAPGNRAEFIIKGGAPGRYGVRALAFDQGHPGGPRPEKMLATLVSAGEQMDGPLPGTLVPPLTIPDDAPYGQDRTVTFKGNIETKPVRFYLDGKQFDLNRLDQIVKVDTWEEWTLVNEDVFRHPFHIHVNPFQVIEINGEPVADPVWWDTIAIPPRGTMKIRMYYRPDVTGKTVYHCHILPHEDNGMMANIYLSKDGKPPEKTASAAHEHETC